MLVRGGLAEIDGSQQHENISLDEGDADVQSHEGDRYGNGASEKKTMVTMSPANMLA